MDDPQLTGDGKHVNVTALREILKRPGSVPCARSMPPNGAELLNALADVFDLPLDCYGLDISIRAWGVLQVAVHRYPAVKFDEQPDQGRPAGSGER